MAQPALLTPLDRRYPEVLEPQFCLSINIILSLRSTALPFTSQYQEVELGAEFKSFAFAIVAAVAEFIEEYGCAESVS